MGIYGFCMHTSVQLPFFLCQDPLSQQAEASPAHKFPEDESSAALGAQQYQLFILPGLWDQRHLLYQQLIFSEKRSCQKFKSGLLCGSAEFYTQSTVQGALYLIWFYFAVLILRSKNGSIIVLACQALSHHSSHTRVQTSSRLKGTFKSQH